jgi:hypothetical protein
MTTRSTCENEGDFNKFSSRDLLKFDCGDLNGMYTFYSVRLKIIQEENAFLRDVHLFRDKTSLLRTDMDRPYPDNVHGLAILWIWGGYGCHSHGYTVCWFNRG